VPGAFWRDPGRLQPRLSNGVGQRSYRHFALADGQDDPDSGGVGKHGEDLDGQFNILAIDAESTSSVACIRTQIITREEPQLQVANPPVQANGRLAAMPQAVPPARQASEARTVTSSGPENGRQSCRVFRMQPCNRCKGKNCLKKNVRQRRDNYRRQQRGDRTPAPYAWQTQPVLAA